MPDVYFFYKGPAKNFWPSVETVGTAPLALSDHGLLREVDYVYTTHGRMTTS
jgi:hypothetical protein